MYEVLRPKREKRGIAEDKNDGADAERAARDVMAGHGLSEPKPQDGWVEGVRVLLNARDQAVKACTSLSNAARSMLITADESMRRPYEGMAADKLMKSLMRVEGVGDIGGATADALKVLAATGRICANAKYVGLGFTPWSGTTGPTHRQYLTKVTFAADMATYSYLNLIYCFYSCTNLASVVGLSNLRGVRSLRYAFSSCAFTSIDFRGFDPSTLTDLFYTFSGCSSLATIYADSTWALPTSGITGSQCFYSCRSLVGGNGTSWSSSNVNYTYMRIDKAGQAGYPTAA